jgi:hypothetical protein
MRRYLIIVLVCILLLSLTTTMYTVLSVTLSVYIFFCMLDKFGKGIVLLETMAFYACVIYLLMPLLGYFVYTADSRVAVMWVRVMPVSFQTYYEYTLPAITTYLLGLFLINYVTGRVDEGQRLNVLISDIKRNLQNGGKRGLYLIAAGTCFYFIRVLVPGPVAAIASFGYLLIFPGILYLHFQPKFKGRTILYLLLGAFFIRDAINTGMFTVFFYMSITIVSFFMVGRKISFPTKLVTVIAAICSLFVLQLVKGAFRKNTWGQQYTGSKTALFQDLIIEKASGFSEIFSEKTFFPIYSRINQGYVSAMVMKRIPAKQPFDNGESIAKTLAASVVPRVLWPDKPESGGVYNMQHFAGFKLRGWSTNIGPIGEAYGNFGVGGGIVYMFFFGLFIGWVYKLIFRMSRKRAVLLLWIPLLFFEVMYSMENDTLQALNSLIKTGFFVWVIYKLFPSMFPTGGSASFENRNNENSDHLRHNRAGWSLPR